MSRQIIENSLLDLTYQCTYNLIFLPGKPSDAFTSDQEDEETQDAEDPQQQSIQSPIPQKQSDQSQELNPKYSELLDFVKNLYPEKPDFIYGDYEESEQRMYLKNKSIA